MNGVSLAMGRGCGGGADTKEWILRSQEAHLERTDPHETHHRNLTDLTERFSVIESIQDQNCSTHLHSCLLASV